MDGVVAAVGLVDIQDLLSAPLLWNCWSSCSPHATIVVDSGAGHAGHAHSADAPLPVTGAAVQPP